MWNASWGRGLCEEDRSHIRIPTVLSLVLEGVRSVQYKTIVTSGYRVFLSRLVCSDNASRSCDFKMRG